MIAKDGKGGQKEIDFAFALDIFSAGMKTSHLFDSHNRDHAYL